MAEHPQPLPDGTRFAPRWQSEASVASLVLDGEEPAEAPARDVLEEHPLDRVARTELEHLVEGGFDRVSPQQTEKL